ncbi:phosphoribosylglycinamide formyltransferase [Lactococcus allomyrinae]|uniref:Phosphoribosylglycinamide formyltransferase n=1 Tax=Lactococcus allomyrinae TaxID=2419773 RepID=A0A387BDB2_9LACT|nr:phosphoribosylglycinamide formyltransferase [Lactococcus allomyrinae]AYG00032.1 phosphoribosylglycinamide formyltransferase [Lactococcus allomyrinae]
MNIAVFASGNGSNFQVLAEKFPNNVKLAFSDHHEAYVLKRAEKLNVPAVSFELKEFINKATYESELVEILEREKIDLVVLAGYMKIIGPTLLKKYGGRIINIHPSFLPNFAGSPHAIEESWEANRGLGVTVHYVDEGVDTGDVIAQVTLPYLENLAEYEQSVHEVEYRLYPDVIEKMICR